MSSTAVDMYNDMLVRYPTRAHGRGPHEGFSVLEFQFRLLAIVANAVLRASRTSEAPPLPRTAGLGEWIAYLRLSVRALADQTDEAARKVSGTLQVALAAFDSGGNQVGRIGDLKRLRDHLSHGGPLPDDMHGRATTDHLIDEISLDIEALLGAADLSYGTSKTGLKRPILNWSGSKANLWPGAFLRDETWHVFTRQSTDSVATYMTYDGTAGRSDESAAEILDALRPVLRPMRNRGPFQSYLQDVLEDLKGFAEGDSAFEAAEIDEGFEIVWDKATSEGREPRRDYFRLGLDDRREWRDIEGWTPYSRYLRKLVRWGMVASRLYQSLKSTELELDEEEAEALGWSPSSANSMRAARVEISDFAGPVERSCSFSDMMRGVDGDLESNRGQTQVVFLNGEAGIGKTRAMLDAALNRAEEISRLGDDGDESDLPLYLFVQSTGQVLDNLNTVVAGAVVKTRILTVEGVSALCRNGLMAILIDGFDELLGNARYGDALGSLRPWLTALGGRGVMVVSARSSYYVGQYRSSVLRAQRRDFPLVRHRIAEMQKWSPDEVREFVRAFHLEGELRMLPSEDQRLLRLPFFARVFIERCRQLQNRLDGNPAAESGSVHNSSLAEYLLDQYVAREETKIRGRDGTSILTQSELKQLFYTLAELMDEQSEREADEDLLRLAAQLTIEEELESREGLIERLPALCGLAADGGTDSLRFRFQHELFFDQFLAGAAVGYLIADHEQAFFRMLSNSAWRSATITDVVSKVGAQTMSDTLTSYPASFTADTEQARLILRANAGALWSEVIRITGLMRFDIRSASFADPFDLSGASPGWLRLTDCEVDQVHFPATGEWELTLRDTAVKRIDARESVNLAGLRGVQNQYLRELLQGGELIERRDAIARRLVQLGAQVNGSYNEQSTEAPPELIQAAEFYLGSFNSRAEYSIILDRAMLPADEHPPRWTFEFGRDAWQRFVNAMVQAELATLETFNASGSAKYKFRLARAANQVLERSDSQPQIVAFWRSLT